MTWGSGKNLDSEATAKCLESWEVPGLQWDLGPVGILGVCQEQGFVGLPSPWEVLRAEE